MFPRHRQMNDRHQHQSHYLRSYSAPARRPTPGPLKHYGFTSPEIRILLYPLLLISGLQLAWLMTSLSKELAENRPRTFIKSLLPFSLRWKKKYLYKKDAMQDCKTCNTYFWVTTRPFIHLCKLFELIGADFKGGYSLKTVHNDNALLTQKNHLLRASPCFVDVAQSYLLIEAWLPLHTSNGVCQRG